MSYHPIFIKINVNMSFIRPHEIIFRKMLMMLSSAESADDNFISNFLDTWHIFCWINSYVFFIKHDSPTCHSREIWVNSMVPRRFGCDFKYATFILALLIGIFESSYFNALSQIPPDFIDDESTLVQVMAWCHQAASHYLIQCWPRSVTIWCH